jgi:hypothetical protein
MMEMCQPPATKATATYAACRSKFSRRRSWIGVTRGDLYITQRGACVERGHDEPGSEHVRVDRSETGSLPIDRTHR